jgi:hypothetical protein
MDIRGRGAIKWTVMMALEQVKSFGRIGFMSRKCKFVCSVHKLRASSVERYLVVCLDFAGANSDKDGSASVHFVERGGPSETGEAHVNPSFVLVGSDGLSRE